MRLNKSFVWILTILTLLTSLSFRGDTVHAEGNRYTGWSEFHGSYSSAFYLGEENSTDRYVAYCYNKTLEAPPRKVDGTVYYQKTDGTPQDYGQSLYHPINDQEKEVQLVRDLRRVLFHGYPNNSSRLLEQFNVNYVPEVQRAELFREVTQWGVWHYTDGFDPEVYYKKDFELASGNARQINDLKVSVYKMLIDESLQEADPAFEMELFTTDEISAESGNRYQNLLVTKNNMPLPQPPENPYGRADAVYITKAAVVDGKIQPEALTGAKLEIRAGEGLDGELIMGSDELAMYGNGLGLEDDVAEFWLQLYGKKFGDVFTLIETEAPEGYRKTEPIVFRVSGDMENLGGEYWIEIKQPDGAWKRQVLPTKDKFENADLLSEKTLFVYDEKADPEYDITFKKTDEAGGYLPGAEFALYKEADPINPIRTFITGNQNVSLKLEAGNYILRERLAPSEYVKIDEDIRFTVNDQGQVVSSGATPEGITFHAQSIECKNKKEVVEEIVTLKVKKLWDSQEKQDHPDTKFGLFKDNVLDESTVQTLSKDMKEITWEDIKKSELQSYSVFELTEKDGKFVQAGKYITLNGKTYEVIPMDTAWKAEEDRVYSFTYNNSSITVVKVEKEWQDKDGTVLHDHLPTTNIHIAATDGTHEVREDKQFDAATLINDYYITSALSWLSFTEENVQLQLNHQVEVTIGGKVWLATLTQTSENHYKVVNKEKALTHAVKVSKKSGSEAGAELKDATLKVFKETDDERTAQPIKEWKTTEAPEELMLEEGSYKLVESEAPQGYRKAETIHFTVNDDGTIAVTGQQLQPGEPIIMVDKAMQTVTIEKKVTGINGDRQKEFNFTLTVDADDDLKNGEILSGKLHKDGQVSNVEITVGSEYSFKLKDTDKLEVTGLVDGSIYNLNETEYNKDGYTTTVMVNDKEKKNADTDTAYTVSEGKNNVVFTNHNGKIVPTGILFDIMPYLIDTALVILSGIAFLLSIKRRIGLENAKK